MSLCPICGCYGCSHTREQRGQTREEMFRLLRPEEKEALDSGNDLQKLKVAKKNAHIPVVIECHHKEEALG